MRAGRVDRQRQVGGDDGDATPLQVFGDQAGEHSDTLLVERGGGLVEQPQWPRRAAQPRQMQPLFLSLGQARDHQVPLPLQTRARQRCGRCAGVMGPLSVQLPGEPKIFGHAQRVFPARCVADVGTAVGKTGRVFPLDRSRDRAGQSRQRAQQRRLPAAVRPGDADPLARRGSKRQPVEQLPRAARATQIFDSKHQRTVLGPSSIISTPPAAG